MEVRRLVLLKNVVIYFISCLLFVVGKSYFNLFFYMYLYPHTTELFFALWVT